MTRVSFCFSSISSLFASFFLDFENDLSGKRMNIGHMRWRTVHHFDKKARTACGAS